MDDDPLKIANIRIARKCMRIVYENIYFAIGVKVICLILGAQVLPTCGLRFCRCRWMVIAVLNAIRYIVCKEFVQCFCLYSGDVCHS